MESARGEVTRLLDAWSAGESDARERLLPILYDELRALAGSYMRRERAGHTLQPTALVNEAVVRLYDTDTAPSSNRRELVGLLAHVMRNVLVDHARRKRAEKRGAGEMALEFDEALGDGARDPIGVVELDLALRKLADLDERQARVVELRAFGGLEVTEVAKVLGVGTATVKRDWRTAKLWLDRELRG